MTTQASADGGGGGPLLTRKVKYAASKASNVMGMLVIYEEKLTFAPSDATACTPVEVALGAITKQQRSPSKPMLRIVTASGAFVFEFRNLEDRDGAIDVLDPLLARAGKARPGGAAAADQERWKKELLEGDPDLRELHATLVGSGMITAAEFWQGKQALLTKLRERKAKQRRGVSTTALVLQKPKVDGKVNRIEFSVSPEHMHQIFAERPAVRRAYLAHVGNDMTAQQFWLRYFRYMYSIEARRQKRALGQSEASVEVDEEAEKMFWVQPADSKAAEEARVSKLRRVDPTVDLARDTDDGFTQGYGLLHQPGVEGKAAGEMSKIGTSGTSWDIMSSLNSHAAAVVNAPEMPDDPTTAAKKAQEEEAVRRVKQEPGVKAADAPATRAHQRKDAVHGGPIGLADLAGPTRPTFEPLAIHDTAAYFTTGGSLSAAEGLGAHDFAALQDEALGHLPQDGGMPPGACARVLLDIMRRGEPDDDGTQTLGSHGSAYTVLGQQLVATLRGTALSLNELLRHFWGTLPARTPAAAAKFKRVYAAIGKQFKRIEAMPRAAPDALKRAYISQVLRSLVVAIEAADEAYEKWERQQPPQRA